MKNESPTLISSASKYLDNFVHFCSWSQANIETTTREDEAVVLILLFGKF